MKFLVQVGLFQAEKLGFQSGGRRIGGKGIEAGQSVAGFPDAVDQRLYRGFFLHRRRREREPLFGFFLHLGKELPPILGDLPGILYPPLELTVKEASLQTKKIFHLSLLNVLSVS